MNIIIKYKHIVLVLLLLGVVSCDFLEKEPFDFLPPVNYYDTAEKLEANLAGVYDELASNNLYGFWYIYRLGIEGDESYYARTTPVTGPQVNDFTPSDGDINRAWQSVWTGIGRANALLENIDTNLEIDIKVRDRIRGEALFLRGYYYFMIVQYWGGVPIQLAPTKDANKVDIPRASAKEVYEQILIDMEEAEKLVADIRTINYGGRVSKSAVRGIMARVCLHMAGYPVYDTSKYVDARKWSKMVMDDTEANHKLIDNYSQIFINYAQDKYDINESIWEIEFFGNATDAFTNWGGVGYVNGPATTNLDVGYQLGSLKTTYKLYKLYKDGDVRRDWSIANFTYVAATGDKKYLTDTSFVAIYNRHVAKFRREYEVLLPKAKTATPQNFPVLRYADVLLMFAEADNEVNQNPTVEAIEAVNKVRRRAWSTGVKSVQIVHGGTGYTTAPTVTFVGGGGTGAEATAKIQSGAVVSVTFNPDAVIGLTRGKAYTAAPEVVFTGGNGTGAVATATIFTTQDADLSGAETADYQSFKQLIQDERLRELSSECLRKSDLIRWEQYIYEMHKIRDNIMQYNPTAPYLRIFSIIWERHLLWPIPAVELGLNKAMVQNPNW